MKPKYSYSILRGVLIKYYCTLKMKKTNKKNNIMTSLRSISMQKNAKDSQDSDNGTKRKILSWRKLKYPRKRILEGSINQLIKMLQSSLPECFLGLNWEPELKEYN